MITSTSDVTYTDGPRLPAAVWTYEWGYGLGDVVNAVIRAGLVITALDEHEISPWAPYPGMVAAAQPGWLRLPDGAPRLPLLYALCAVRPS